MRVEIIKRYSREDIDDELQHFEQKYVSLENLHQKVSTIKCGSPHYLEDYIVWKSCADEDAKLTERNIFTVYDVYRAFTPRRMMILNFISSQCPSSIKEISEELKIDYKNIHRDVSILVEYGLVTLRKRKRHIRQPVSLVEQIIIVPEH